MKKILLTTAVIISSLTCKLYAQPQWKFHIAFEDAIGAKDTIWLIWDFLAHGTLPTDTSLGEGKVNFNYNNLNVWVYNYDNDSTKTSALPFNGSFGIEVRAFNYQYPLTISWDSSLFHTPGLPLPVGYVNYARIDNDYFFFQNNLPLEHQFDMLQDNHASAPAFTWFSQSQFPMHFYLARDPSLSINENLNQKINSIFPNPANDFIEINSTDKISEIRIYNSQGTFISACNLARPYSATIKTKDYPPGIYFINIINNLKNHYYKKIIINH